MVAVEHEEDVVDLMDVSVYDAGARTGDLLALDCFSLLAGGGDLLALASTRRGRAAARGRQQGVGVYAWNRRGPVLARVPVYTGEGRRRLASSPSNRFRLELEYNF
jgi:hypothetical protein